MLNLIRRAFDADRLAWELGRAEREIESLREELKRVKTLQSVPHFQAVAQDFDAKPVMEHLCRRVERELGPVLERSALAMLKNAMADVRRSSPIYGRIARVGRSGNLMTHYSVQLQMPEYRTTVEVVTP